VSTESFEDIASYQAERIRARVEVQADVLQADLVISHPDGPGRLILDATISGHAQAHPLEKLHALRRLQKQLIPQFQR